MLVSSTSIILYVLNKFKTLPDLGNSLGVSDISVVFSSALLVLAALAYFWPAKREHKAIPGSLGSKAAHLKQDAVDNSRAQAEVVINAIDDGVIALDGRGNVTLINPAAQKLIGWTGGDALSLNYKSVLKLIDVKDQPVLDTNDPVLLTLNTNTASVTDKFSLTTGSGKKLIVSLVVSPIGDIGSGVIIVFRDITKTKSDEREQAEFISTASHEMRTPVASIEGYLGLALNPNTAQIDQKARDFIEKAHASAQHLGRLFQDLLDVSKADDGRLSNYPKVVDVVEYVADIVGGLKPKADEKGLFINYIPKPLDASPGMQKTVAPVYYVNVDNDHLREVVANLVENAIKYTLKGEVVIDVSGDEDHVAISIKDSGIGIPAEDIPHLFQKFYRVDNSDTREIGGTGLGLYLCRRLAEVMGGRIDLVSEFKKGSTFTLEIPRIGRDEALRQMEEQKRQAAAEAASSATSTASTSVAPVAVPTPEPAPTPAPQVTPPLVPTAPPVQAAPQVVTAQPVAYASPQPQPVAYAQPAVQQMVTTPAYQPQPVQPVIQPAPAVQYIQPTQAVSVASQVLQTPQQQAYAPQPQVVQPATPMQVPERQQPPQNPPGV